MCNSPGSRRFKIWEVFSASFRQIFRIFQLLNQYLTFLIDGNYQKPFLSLNFPLKIQQNDVSNTKIGQLWGFLVDDLDSLKNFMMDLSSKFMKEQIISTYLSNVLLFSINIKYFTQFLPSHCSRQSFVGDTDRNCPTFSDPFEILVEVHVCFADIGLQSEIHSIHFFFR